MVFIDFYWSNWSWYKVEPVVHYSKLILHCGIRCKLLYNIIHIAWSISRDQRFIYNMDPLYGPYLKFLSGSLPYELKNYLITKSLIICKCATRWHRCKDKICTLFFCFENSTIIFFDTISIRIIIVLTFESL